MVHPEAAQPEQNALQQAIYSLEQLGNEYTDLMLMDSVVHVDLKDMEAMFTLPREVAEAFAYIGAPTPQLISTMGLDLQYDRALQQFSISKGAAVFDNGYGLAFTDPIPAMNSEDTAHNVDLFRYDENGVFRFQRIMPIATEQMQNFFQQCGIDIPLAPYPASWEAIGPVLSIAQQHTVTAQRASLVSPHHELRVVDQIIENVPALSKDDMRRYPPSWLPRTTQFEEPDIFDNSESTDTQGWLHETSLQVVDERDIAIKSIEVVLLTESPLERPAFRGLYTHDKPRKFVTPTKSPLDAALLEELPRSDLITDEQELLHYTAYITQAVRAASNNILG